jgi:hypothetical protein
MRPITSFKKKTLGQNKNFLKNILFDTQKIFKYIQNKMQKNRNNCVIFDYKEIMKRLMDYKLRLIKCNPNSQIIKQSKSKNSIIPKYLSYVTMDIEACYDNIDIQLLNDFIERDETIGSTYVTGILYILIPKINKTKNPSHIEFKDCFDIKLMYIVSDLREYIHILDYIEKREEISYKNCIIYIDNTKLVYLSKAQFMPTVKNIINNNYIKFDKKFLRQSKGIPQGLSVSSFLCNLFFYEIEQDLSFEIQKIVNLNQSLLLRFMDDYLCLSNSTEKAIIFKDSSVDLSTKNKFNFNLKKLQSNLNNITNNSNKKVNDLKKFSWNGMFFELNQKHFFNLIYDNNKSDENDKLINYTKLVNINLPLVTNKNDFTWLVKKINAVLFSGHPWIYFMSTINEKEILEKNFQSLIKFMFFKLLVLIRKIENTILKPSQNNLINVIDTFMMKMYSFIDSKVVEIEKKNFYIPYNIFHKYFYITMFKLYFYNDKEYNQKIIKYSPLLFKTIKRKIERFKIAERKYSLKEKYDRQMKFLSIWFKKPFN